MRAAPRLTALFLFIGFLAASARAQEPLPTPFALDAAIPLDPAVLVDTLPNGLVLYVRENHEPRDRAELRLVVNAGSVLEDDAQRGLAHLLEHMAFNGTARFAKQELIDYLESIGMRFGPDVNAYTSFDETVYLLTVPTDSLAQLATGLDVLAEWAQAIVLDPAEVDRERPVVVEEWRLGRGAEARLRDTHLPVVFHASRYAERLPIGEKAVVETASIDELRRFYRDWYRPDLMAVIAVGDFDGDSVAAWVRARFEALPTPAAPRPRETYPVPDHPGTLVSIATDPEMPFAVVALHHKRPARDEATVAGVRRSLVEALHDMMLNARLSELVRREDAPFLAAFAGQDRLVRPTEIAALGAVAREGELDRALTAIVVEAERTARHGFAAGELTRAKADLLRGVESAYDERDKTPSASHAQQAADHYLTGVASPDAETSLALVRQLLPTIAVGETDSLARVWLGADNRVVLVSAPEKAGVAAPTAAAIEATLAAASAGEIAPWEDRVAEGPLVATPPPAGAIVAERELEVIGAMEWTLSNGARVIVKPTDFKDDEVLLGAWSPGGTSLLPDSLIVTADLAGSIVPEGGLGTMDHAELEKATAGMDVGITPWIQDLSEGLNGSASPRDLETLFQLAWLTFTAPHHDPAAFAAFRSRLEDAFANRAADPDAAFQDTLQTTLYQHHPRVWLATTANAARLDPEAALAFYRDRFADAADFTFFVVGSFDPDSLRPLVSQWLASLPATDREESWRDAGIDPPPGVIEKTVRRGIEPSARIEIVFTGPLEWTPESGHAMNTLGEYLRIRLREILREDLGGTYGVGVGGQAQRWPDGEYRVHVGFGADPARIAALADTLEAELAALRAGAVDEVTVAKVREGQRRDLETNRRENGWWLGQLMARTAEGQELESIAQKDELIEQVSAELIREAAERWLDPARRIQVTLLPEE